MASGRTGPALVVVVAVVALSNNLAECLPFQAPIKKLGSVRPANDCVVVSESFLDAVNTARSNTKDECIAIGCHLSSRRLPLDRSAG